MKWLGVAMASALLAVLSLVSASVGAPLYQVVDLGTLAGTQSTAYGINAQGKVCGYSNVTGSVSSSAFLWQDGAMIDVSPLGFSGSSASGINDKGHVVGVTYRNQVQYAFLWEDGVATIIGNGYACAINNSDEVVGYWGFQGQGQRQAFRYRGGVMTSLGAGNTAWAINNNGQIVGDSVRNSDLCAVLWQNEQMTYLDSLGGHSSRAKDINDVGEIVGHSTNVQGQYHAVLWQDGNIIDLGSLGGFATYANAINNHHQVVGFAMTPGSSFYGAFIWQNGVMMDINTLIPNNTGWTVYHAQDINDSGQIVGLAVRDGQGHAVLLNPVPEPSSILALFCGIGGLAWQRKNMLGHARKSGTRSLRNR